MTDISHWSGSFNAGAATGPPTTALVATTDHRARYPNQKAQVSTQALSGRHCAGARSSSAADGHQ